MKVQTLVMGLVGLAVIIMIVSAVVIPTVEDAQYNTVTEKQNTTQFYQAVPNDKLTTTISFSDSTLTVGSNTFTTAANRSLNVLLADNIIINVGATMSVSDIDNGLSLTGLSSFSASITNGVLAYTYSAVDYTVNLSGNVFIISDKGDYGVFLTVQTVYVDRGAYISFSEPSKSATGGTIFYRISGTMESLKATVWFHATGSSEFVDISDTATITNTAVLADDGPYYKLESGSSVVKLTYELSGTPTTIDVDTAFYGSIVAPIAYHVTDTSSSVFALLGVIPIMLIIVAVMYAVRLMGSKN